MTIIDLVRNEGDRELLAWRYPKRQLSTWTQLIVGEGEVAVLLTDRAAADLFPTGRHTLETANLPLLGSLLRLPFGGRSPFEAEIWYLDIGEIPALKWGTDTPVQLTDDSNGKPLSMRGYGQFGVQIENPRIFLTSLCRNLSNYGRDDLTATLRAPMMAVVKDCMADYLRSRGSASNLAGGLMELSAMVRERLEPELLRYGIRLCSFYVSGLHWTPPEGGDAG